MPAPVKIDPWFTWEFVEILIGTLGAMLMASAVGYVLLRWWDYLADSVQVGLCAGLLSMIGAIAWQFAAYFIRYTAKVREQRAMYEAQVNGQALAARAAEVRTAVIGGAGSKTHQQQFED